VTTNTPFGTASTDNLARAHRKRTLVDELVDDAEARRYAKRKFEDLQAVRGARGKNTLHQKNALRRPKWWLHSHMGLASRSLGGMIIVCMTSDVIGQGVNFARFQDINIRTLQSTRGSYVWALTITYANNMPCLMKNSTINVCWIHLT